MQEFTPGNTDKARSVCILLVGIPKFWIYRNVRNCCETKRVREHAAQGQDGLRSQVLRAELTIRPNTRLQWRLSFYQRERYRFETVKVFTWKRDERSDKRDTVCTTQDKAPQVSANLQTVPCQTVPELVSLLTVYSSHSSTCVNHSVSLRTMCTWRRQRNLRLVRDSVWSKGPFGLVSGLMLL